MLLLRAGSDSSAFTARRERFQCFYCAQGAIPVLLLRAGSDSSAFTARRERFQCFYCEQGAIPVLLLRAGSGSNAKLLFQLSQALGLGQ